jgi:hypothetical protein
LYSWTSYPLTTVLEQIWGEGKADLNEKKTPRCVLVELCSVVERALNYLHTGNAAVIATSVMNPLWIGRAIIEDGMPSINKDIVHAQRGSRILVKMDQWPFDKGNNLPKSVSKRAQGLTYGDGQYNVSTRYLYTAGGKGHGELDREDNE